MIILEIKVIIINHENIRNQCENNENQENHRTTLDNHENHKNHINAAEIH